MIIVGLTGGFGTGKTTVASFFKESGAYVIDWDRLARKVISPHSQAWREVVEHFGKGVLNEDLTVNRQKLADMAFSDKGRLAKLNQIVHPKVFEEDERITNEIRSHDSDALVVKDIPLLFEVGRSISVDKIVVVSASEQTQLRRLEKKGIAREDARNRMRAQHPLEEKVRSADFVIDNDGPPEETRRQVENIYSLLSREAKHRKHRIKERRSRETGR